jgi:UDP-N-acetylglucosamine--N-acetylmuramyl-(pentapeptide) pyrophosphoryl-undecaprenol N-acetylglucosamine transferase
MKTPMKPSKIVFCGGGTGGHIFPAVAIADHFKTRYPEIEIQFIGALNKMEMKRVPEAGYPIIGLPVSGLIRSITIKNILIILNALRSYFKARTILKSFQPNLVIGTGGFASLPVCLAAAHLNIPLFIWEGNGYAGLTNKLLKKHARRIYCGFDDMDLHFPYKNWIHSGNPIREQLLQPIPKNESLHYFGFTEHHPTIFITGGSLGARSINEAVATNVQEWLSKGYQIIWQTGIHFQPSIKHPNLWSHAFLGDMIHAYNLADVVISRSGALSVSEIMACGIPAIFVPSSNVTDDHQTKNAEKACKTGGAILIPDNQLQTELPIQIASLLSDSQRLKTMSERLKLHAKPGATEAIVTDIIYHL